MAKTPKFLPATVMGRFSRLIPIVVVLFVGIGFLQSRIDPDAKKLHEKEKSIASVSGGLNNEFLLLPLLGFREAAAGLLWVRADEFFHSGDYDAILPLVRMITWLDPHADNVYITGAWHLSYNFTDSSERSDRRYIPPALKLLQEGIDNNPNIPDVKFEMGWEKYDKVKEFNGAVEAFKLALATPKSPFGDDPKYGAPLRVEHTLAHALEKAGRIPEALKQWQWAMQRCELEMRDDPKNYAFRQLHEAEKHNFAITWDRYHDRYTTDKTRATKSTSWNTTTYPGIYAPPSGGKPGKWDVSFHPKVELVRSKVLKVSGRITTADGARVDVQVADEDYKPRDVTNALNSFEVPDDQTVLVDSLAIKKTRYERELDMSRDPKMYNFSKPWLKVIVTFNCRSTSPFLQDRFGWSGEGLTNGDPRFVTIDRRPLLLGTKLIEGEDGDGPVWDGKSLNFTQHGQPPRLIRVTFKVSAKDILAGNRTLTDADIVPN